MASVAKILVVGNDLETHKAFRALSLSCPNELIFLPSARDAMTFVQQGLSVKLVLFDVDNHSDDNGSRHSLIEWSGSDRLCLLSNNISNVNPGIGRILLKPIEEASLNDLVMETTSHFISSHRLDLRSERNNLPYHLEELRNNRFFLASSPTMMKLYKEIRLLAPVKIPVLLLGESGVGKEIVALLLHKYHGSSDSTFLNVNCAALPNDLLESELFGYEAGAFTGAMKSKPGKFELAHKGTLLLDEIGEMNPQMQAKLLHVLQDGSFTRLGGRTPTKVDVRMLAATNIDIHKGIAERRFREDLYYRLNTFTITIPPLRERREEIPFLIKEMVSREASELSRPFIIEDWLIEAAQDYQWPGNLRELRNFVMRTLILQDQQGAYHDLRMKSKIVSSGRAELVNECQIVFSNTVELAGMKGTISEVKNKTEVRLLSEALTASGWNRRKAAVKLNISYRSLLYKIQQHGLSA